MQNFVYQSAMTRPLARDVIFDCLAEDIAQLRLTPGVCLSAANLEDEFGVSRTPIREALIRLSHLGLIELSPSARTRATPICARAQVHRAQTAAAFIISAARAMTSRLSAGQRRELHRYAALVRGSVGSETEATHWWSFAQAIVSFGGNTVMRELFDVNLGLHLRRSLHHLDVPHALSEYLLRSLDEAMSALEIGDGPAVVAHVSEAVLAATGAVGPGLCASPRVCRQCAGGAERGTGMGSSAV